MNIMQTTMEVTPESSTYIGREEQKNYKNIEDIKPVLNCSYKQHRVKKIIEKRSGTFCHFKSYFDEEFAVILLTKGDNTEECEIPAKILRDNEIINPGEKFEYIVSEIPDNEHGGKNILLEYRKVFAPSKDIKLAWNHETAALLDILTK